MGCRNREFSGEERAVQASLSDALLFTTMCIIGLPVDVHVKDGSIYSGIFHTACVENDYGVVLKKARMTKKGNCDANVASGDVIETLVVVSEDLVQVVAKGILLPGNGVACNVAGDYVGDIADTIPSLECADREVKMEKSSKTNTDRMQTSKTRRTPHTENGITHRFTGTKVCHVGNPLEVEHGKSDGIRPVKKDEASSALVNGRQVGDGRSQGKQFDYEAKSDFQKKEPTHEVQGSGSSFDACFTQSKAVEGILSDMSSKLLPNSAPSDHPLPSIGELNNQCQDRHTSEENAYSNAISSAVSTSDTSFVKGNTESRVSSSSTLTEMVPPRSSHLASKEFKLNPGAKVFCPSFANHRSVTPPAVPTVANVAYIPDNFPMVPIASAQPEVEINPFVPRSSLPVKFVPYGNLVAGSGISDSQYSQPIIGHIGNRTQPVRYDGQHHHSIQAGPAYMHPNSQNVMVGRLGQLIYMHPFSHDVNQGAAPFSQVSNRHLLTPHQGHLPKHQGNAAAQALQLCVTPPFIAGQQPFAAAQSHIPLPQPPFPVIRSIPVPGSNGLFSTKFP
ncbi:Polyadenylate-binding protein-interacting protein 4 [Camellia lanceoleosa]|uniref:Polyadenylate-binding protein-interacting protein 4 n=1 Tax=Camellia lanceoleosa TaxID=1840588 RepID=A0ACC0H135_9ERIC|nr:Polyadenylate-binding protein-interacting protein 4 [Camellia lanceoleosa]